MQKDLLYTLGHKQNYLDAIKNSEDGTIQKLGKNDEYEGGCVFLTKEEAEEYRLEIGEKDWCVWGLKTTIENTIENPEGKYRNLLMSCEIVNIDNLQ